MKKSPALLISASSTRLPSDAEGEKSPLAWFVRNPLVTASVAELPVEALIVITPLLEMLSAAVSVSPSPILMVELVLLTMVAVALLSPFTLKVPALMKFGKSRF